MDEIVTYYADVLLPLHLPGTYTYRIPREMVDVVRVGERVVVQFGQKRMYSALVRRIHTDAPKFKAKYIEGALDEEPILGELQFKFWEWMAQYYMCYPGDVMAVAMPTSLKLASESAISIHPDFDGDLSRLTKYELMVVNLLVDHPVMKLNDISRAIGIQKIMPLIRGMIERQIVMMEEELRNRFIPKTSTYISLTEAYRSEEAQRQLFDQLEQKKRLKQVELMMQFMQLSQFGSQAVAKRMLPQGSALQTLIKNGILATEQRIESRIESIDSNHLSNPDDIVLNEEQMNAYQVLSQQGDSPSSVSLLHGVTSSGKTEVYIKLINDTIKRGKQVLFLLPEIALTAQIINRLRRYFGESVGVYHSRFSASQRAEVWQRTFSEGPSQLRVLLGARSALFLPYRNLGLVIVDEEHDPSYKQQDPAPRYHGRDAAIYLAHLWQAQTVLGSATPSIESYYNAQQGKYRIATIKNRYGGYQLPNVTCIDMKQARKEKLVRGQFSTALLESLTSALQQHRQAILFQNRRGFSLRIECDDCHHIPQCIHCDVSLVYHKSTNSLRCHYCGYSIPIPNQCPACQSSHLHMAGIGTERIEEDLQILFPDANICRFDQDSTSQRNRHLEILTDFQEHRIDILVGTQMVTKGLDFEQVSVVGIINADNIINYPNFRSYERAFQQMTQVSGRAGRHSQDGTVIIQTNNPYHQVIQNVMQNDYISLYQEQINERRIFRYPPFYRLIEITLRHRDETPLNAAADWMADQLRSVFQYRVLGPEYPLVARIRGLYIKTITLRFEKSEAISQAKTIAMQIADQLTTQKGWSNVSVHFDVDPY